MEFIEVPPTDPAVRRFVTTLEVPYQKDLAAATDLHEVAPDPDIVESQVTFRKERLETDGFAMVVAVDPPDGGIETREFAEVGGDLVGFVATDVERAPALFEMPDRLVVAELFVTDPYRGTGLAEDLLARAAARAEREDCPELKLEVALDNERACRFYERVGFEHARSEMHAETETLLD